MSLSSSSTLRRPFSSSLRTLASSSSSSSSSCSSSTSSSLSPQPRYTSRSLASHAYHPHLPPSSQQQHPHPAEATRPPPAGALTPPQKEVIARILRVDQAGELGANWIYRGQKLGSALRRDWRTVKEVEEMWENERHHLATASLLSTQHSVRPTLLYPLWQAMAFGLGVGTALASREAAMACTEAVETVIGEHYDDQLRALEPLIAQPNAHPSLPLLRDILTEFRDDELEHLNKAVEGGAQKAPGHSLLSAMIGAGCKVAIKICERV